MNIHLRLETTDDHRAIEELTRDAFWGRNHPDCDEHLLVHKLRGIPAFIPELDYVAEIDGKLAGNVMYSKSWIVCGDGTKIETINFGPLSVLPEYQNKGVGKALMTHTIDEARLLGYRAIIFFGHPDYYPRFGFRRAAEFGITTWDGNNFDAFMAMPLYGGALDGINGRYYEDPVFNLDANEVAEFDKSFPYKARRVLEPIEVLQTRLEPKDWRAIQELNIKPLCHLRGKSQREIKQAGLDDSAIDTIRAVMLEHGYRWGESQKNQ